MPYIPLSAPTTSGTKGGYIPLGSLGSGSPAPQNTQNNGIAQGITQSKFAPGTQSGYGASNLKDTSQKPLATFIQPLDTVGGSSMLLSNRVASSFDPTIAQKLTPDMLQNGRMPQGASSKIKTALGGNSSEELDHRIALELSGSNQPQNLALEPHAPGSNLTTTDPLENVLAHRVVKGEVSLLDAQRQLAKAKGFTLQEDQGTQTTQSTQPTYESGAGKDFLKAFPSTIKTLAELQIDPLTLKADPKKTLSSAMDTLTGALKQQLPQVKDNASFSERLGAFLKGTAQIGGAVFSPISAFFKGAEQLPVLGSISKLITLPFSVMGDAGPDTAKVLVDKLPIPQSAKNNIVDGLGEVFALAGQLAAGKVLSVGQDKINELTKTFGTEDAKTIVSKAQELAKESSKETKPLEVPKETPKTNNVAVETLSAQKSGEIKGAFSNYKKIGQEEGNRTPYESLQTTRDTGSLHSATESIAQPTEKAPVPLERLPKEGEAYKELPMSTPASREKGLIKSAGTGEKIATSQATAQRMSEKYGLNPEHPEYNKLNTKEDIKKAASFTTGNYDVAKKIALGKETPPPEQTITRIRDAVIAKAELEGDYQTLSDVINTKITAGTRYGQEIQAYSDMTTNEHSAEVYMRKLIKDRYKSAAKKYSGFIENKRESIGKGKTNPENIIKGKIKEGTEILKKSLKEIDFGKAEDLLNKIIC